MKPAGILGPHPAKGRLWWISRIDGRQQISPVVFEVSLSVRKFLWCVYFVQIYQICLKLVTKYPHSVLCVFGVSSLVFRFRIPKCWFQPPAKCLCIQLSRPAGPKSLGKITPQILGYLISNSQPQFYIVIHTEPQLPIINT